MNTTLFFSVIDALVPFVVLVVIGFLIRSVMNGDFRTDPNHCYEECQVHAYNTSGVWDLYYDRSTLRYFHEECAKEYLADNLKTDEWYEVWVNEKNTHHRCQHCE